MLVKLAAAVGALANAAVQRMESPPDPGGAIGWAAKNPRRGGECSSNCTQGRPGCPRTISRERCETVYSVMVGNLDNLISNGTAANPAGRAGTSRGSRSLPSAALALLMSRCPRSPGCCPPSTAACVQPPSPAVCADAIALLKRFGDAPGTSFGGQAYPLLWHTFEPSCFPHGSPDRAWFLSVLNASLPATPEDATPQEVSYTNMYLMSAVNAILFGEIVGGERGTLSAAVGYEMWEGWRKYTAAAGLHEYVSPTYGYVQLTALYPGYLLAARPGARAQFGAALDLIWAETASNTFGPRGALSGPHSRDYDTLLGHGMLYYEVSDFWTRCMLKICYMPGTYMYLT